VVLQTGGLLYRDDVMSKMKDLVDERTRRGRLKIDQKYRNNHSGLHARRHLNVAFFCETTTFISSVDLSSSNRKYKYKTTLSRSLALCSD
jgi:Ser-tRNA(Ala) deacylase AlaX